jgi:hydroxymethylbilane synthase
LRAATRGSALALWQTHHVAALLRAAHATLGVDVEVEPVVVETAADRRLDISIEAMGGKGVFVKEVQAAVLDGRADIAVHSAKDLPSRTPDALVIAGVPERADARDVLVGTSLRDLRAGAHIATGSVRRRVQLAAHRPDLRFSGLRGNIATRLAKASEYDAIVMAKAALDRLELEPGVVDVLPADLVVPQVGQGALAVECRADDAPVIDALGRIDHRRSHVAVLAERAFLAELGGDCSIPAGAHAVLDGALIRLDAVLATPDEEAIHRESATGDDPEPLGTAVARRLRDRVGHPGP